MIARLRPELGIQELIEAWKPSDHQKSVQCFEREFAVLMNVKHAIAFPYGRTGLVMLLKALGLEDKEVICPAYTCVVVPHAIVFSGNKPIFVDSQEHDFNMDLKLAEQAINENTGGIIATSIFGYPVDLEHLDRIKKKYPHIRVIQDCAHSFAAEWKGIPVHKAGDAAIFGLNISKLMHSIFGGMVVTDNDLLAEKLRIIRRQTVKEPTMRKSWKRRLYLAAVYPAFSPFIYGIVNFLDRSGLLDSFTKYYSDDMINMPKDYLVGMTGVEANVGVVQAQKYAHIIGHRRHLASMYDQELCAIPGLRLPPSVVGATYSHYVIRVPDRQDVLNYALKKGIQCGQLIEYCIPEMKAYRETSGNRYVYPISGQMAKDTVNLPLWINEKACQKVCTVIRNYFDS